MSIHSKTLVKLLFLKFLQNLREKPAKSFRNIRRRTSRMEFSKIKLQVTGRQLLERNLIAGVFM